MEKEDLIKHITESLEESLPEDLVYYSPSVQTTTGFVVDKTSTIGNIRIVRKEFNVGIDFVGMVK